jgi:hypothetical protein
MGNGLWCVLPKGGVGGLEIGMVLKKMVADSVLYIFVYWSQTKKMGAVILVAHNSTPHNKLNIM